jgi:opine dehydrogenase
MEDYIVPMQQGGGIQVTGVCGEGFARLNKITTDVGEAIKGVDVIVIVVEAQRQKRSAELCTPYLKADQIVFLQPGNAGGALEFAHTLKSLGVVKYIPVAETTGLFINYRRGPAAVEIVAIKNDIAVGVFPGKRAGEIIDTLNQDFGELVPASNVLETSLSNVNHLLHHLSGY